MTVKLSEELQKAVDANKGMPVEVEHPVTHKIFVLIEQPAHEKAMKALQQQEVLNSIQVGIEEMEAGGGTSLEEAEANLREELGFPKS